LLYNYELRITNSEFRLSDNPNLIAYSIPIHIKKEAVPKGTTSFWSG